jgi:hypothetical protein
MALVLLDRVKELTSVTGYADIDLQGAPAGYQTFSNVGDGNTCYYTISSTTSEWEVGIGTYTSSGDTLSRDTVLSSSNAGSPVNFSLGSKDVYLVYPAEKAIYEEVNGETLFNGGPITVVGPGSPGYTSFGNTLFQAFSNVPNYSQGYLQNLSDDADASTDWALYNNQGDGTYFFIDMGIASSNYSSGSYPIFQPNDTYVYSYGNAAVPSRLLLGTQSPDANMVFFTGGVDTVNTAMTISGADQSITMESDLSVAGTFNATGAATFGSTVLLDADPTTALQAATKQYVDNATSAGIHIHEQVYVEKDSNLAGVYTQGGTTFNITDITGTNTVTTSTTHGLSVNDQIWLYNTAGNGLSTNTAYFVYAIPAGNQLQLSASYGGSLLTGLTNASGLVYNTRANSGVGAYLEASSNAVLPITVPAGFAALAPGDRVLVYQQTNPEQNGVYVVTDLGSLSSKWKITRASDANYFSPQDVNGMSEGDYFFIITISESYVLTTPGSIIIGYTGLTYTLFSAATVYTGTSPINVTGSVISLTKVPATLGGTDQDTVAIGDLLYGSGTNAWSKLGLGAAYKSLVVNGSGTQVEWNAVALNQSGAVSGTLTPTNGGTGLSAYSTGDVIYASATNTLSALAGNITTTRKYLGQTGTGSASQAPTWTTLDAGDITSGVLGVAYGGTSYGTYTAGDILYASGTGSLSKLGIGANTYIMTSNGSGPQWTIPSSITVGSATSAGSATTATTATNLAGGALGSVPYQSSAATTVQLAGNTTTTKKFFTQTGDGINSAIPGWNVIIAGDVPTLNQNTTGSAATLTTARNIYGNSFNGSADVTGIIASTYGGTGNGFAKFSGPAASEKTFTLPNASATILTDNATVTVAQGGTGATSQTAYAVLTGGTTSTGAFQSIASVGTSGQVLTSNGAGALPTFQTVSAGLTVTNDTTTATPIYPTFTSATSGSITSINVTSTKLNFTPSTGALAAPEIVASNGMLVHSATVSTSYSIPAGSNAIAAGPMTVASGAAVTIPSGSRWLVL